MKKFGRKTTLNLRYGGDKGSHSVVSDWKGYDFMEIVEKKETNADRIRNMSDEELTEFITGLSKHCLAGIGKCDCSAYKTCDNCNVEVKKWLQSEAEYEEI